VGAAVSNKMKLVLAWLFPDLDTPMWRFYNFIVIWAGLAILTKGAAWWWQFLVALAICARVDFKKAFR
jgi:hypothetical protein